MRAPRRIGRTAAALFASAVFILVIFVATSEQASAAYPDDYDGVVYPNPWNSYPLGPTGPYRPKPAETGSAGDSITWTATNGWTRLYIEGSGPMWDWPRGDDESPPWSGFDLAKVIIGPGVTYVGENTFRYNRGVAVVSLYDGLEKIGNSAFANTSISEILIPGTVTEIGSSAFAASDLVSVTVPDTVTYVGNNAFARCRLLQTAVIGDGVTVITQGMFADTYALASLTIGANVDTIQRWVLNESALESLHLPAKVRYISDAAFSNRGKDALKDITVDPANPYFASTGHALYSKDMTNLIRLLPAADVNEFIIPESVRSVLPYSMYMCDSLTAVTLPSALVFIGEQAFYGCTGIKELIIPDSVVQIGRGGVDTGGILDMLYIGNGVERLTPYTVPAMSSAKTLVIGSGTARIDYGALRNNSNLESIDVSIASPYFTSIAGVLYNKSITNVLVYPTKMSGHYTMPNSVTYVGDNVFRGTAIGSVTLSSNLYAIGYGAFAGTSLTAIKFPQSLRIIGAGAFEGCHDLEYVYFEGGTMPHIGVKAFAARSYGSEPLRVYSPLAAGFMDSYSGNLDVIYNDSDTVYGDLIERMMNNTAYVLSALVAVSAALIVTIRIYHSRERRA